MPHIHPFLYSAPRHDHNRPAHFAWPRDPEANSQLQIALSAQGFHFGRTILNVPGEKVRYDLAPVNELRRVELPFVRAGDALTLATRPPLSDGWHGDAKRIEVSNTTLERIILDLYSRYFVTCARSYLQLSEEAARYLPNSKKNRQMMTVFQYGFAYQYLQAAGSSRSKRSPLGPTSPGFLLRVDELWPGGPGFVGAFGMNAIATLALCMQLRFRFSDLLSRRGLTMVELTPTEMPDQPATYDFMLDWNVEEVFSTHEELSPQSNESTYAISL